MVVSLHCCQKTPKPTSTKRCSIPVGDVSEPITIVTMFLNYVSLYELMTDSMDDATKKMKNAQQDVEAKAETEQDHAEGKPSSETLNKAKNKVEDALS